MGDKLKETSEKHTMNAEASYTGPRGGGGLLNGFKITLNMCQDLQNPQTSTPNHRRYKVSKHVVLKSDKMISI